MRTTAWMWVGWAVVGCHTTSETVIVFGSSDTGSTPGERSAAGTWMGTCSADGTTSWDFLGVEVMIELSDVDGQLAGTASMAEIWTSGTYTGSDVAFFVTSGSRVDDAVSLEHWERTYADDPADDYVSPFVLEATLDGDALDGDLIFYPDGTYGYAPMAWSCALTR
ncbi:MAG: hypothetical protein KC621_01740 [Myxococcales bacterium]|nr:hypothetical protein [Myxococcales bacterium]